MAAQATVFINSFIDMSPAHDRARKTAAVGLWKVFVMEQIKLTIDPQPRHKNNLHCGRAGGLNGFVRWLQPQPWLLGDAFVVFQAELNAAPPPTDPEDLIVALLD